jgi:hypothetical protein
MAHSLSENMCFLPTLGTLISEVSKTALRQHLASALIYACHHWIEYVEHGQVSLDDDGPVYDFLQQYCALWVEIMSLTRKLPEAMRAMKKLESFISVSGNP